MVLTVQEYRGVTELADMRLESVRNYWSEHLANVRLYEQYLAKLLTEILIMNHTGVDEKIPKDLKSWLFRFSHHIDLFKSYVKLYDSFDDEGEYLDFLKFILEGIQPTCSRPLNNLQLAEIEFVIVKLEKLPETDSVKELREIADKEFAILSEDYTSYYLNYRFCYLREPMNTILNQDLYYGAVRSAFFDKICTNTQFVEYDEKDWAKAKSAELNAADSKSYTSEEWYKNNLLFLNELLADTIMASVECADDPDDLPQEFLKGIGMLMRCDEVDFILHSAEAAHLKLSSVADKGDETPDWVRECLNDASDLIKRAQDLKMPIQLRRKNFVMLED